MTVFSRLKSNLDPLLGGGHVELCYRETRTSRCIPFRNYRFPFFIIRFERATIRDRHSCALHNDQRNDVIRSSYYEFRSSLRFFFSPLFFFARKAMFIKYRPKIFLRILQNNRRLILSSFFAYLKNLVE